MSPENLRKNQHDLPDAVAAPINDAVFRLRCTTAATIASLFGYVFSHVYATLSNTFQSSHLNVGRFANLVAATIFTVIVAGVPFVRQALRPKQSAGETTSVSALLDGAILLVTVGLVLISASQFVETLPARVVDSAWWVVITLGLVSVGWGYIDSHSKKH